MVVLGDGEEWEKHRFRSMSLQTLPNTKQERLKQLEFGRVTNRLDDIQGASHHDKWARFTHKPNFGDNNDISGSKPMVLHKHLKKVDRQLYIDDIEGAKPRPKIFKTNRIVDPLTPNYSLPKVVPAAPVPVKYIRNNLDISDIAGSHVQPLHRWQQRDTYTCDDVEGAHAGWKPMHQRARRDHEPHEIMKVDDIVFDGVFHSQRRTNPLDPSYDVNGMHIENDPLYSKPRKLPKRKNCPFFSLVTDDIEGSQSGWKSPGELRPLADARRQWRNTNFVGDIVGAQADTVVHSIKTDRHVNPLNPTYVSLDGEPLANPITPLYKDPATIEAELALQSTLERATAMQAVQQRAHAHQAAMGKASDPRDALIEQLTRQIEAIKAGDQQQQQQQPQPQAHPSRALPPPFPTEQQQPLAAASPSLARQSSPTKKKPVAAPPPLRLDAQSAVLPGAPTPSLPPDFVAPTPAQVEAQSSRAGIFLRTEAGPSLAAERLVLRSSDGKPRVLLTPAEVQAAKVTVADIEAVKNLR